MRKPFFKLALENAAEPPVDDTTGAVPPATEEVPAEEVIESAAAVEEASAEVVSETGDVAELQEAIEEGLNASDTLAEIGEVVESKVEDGEGMPPEAAQVAQVAIESIQRNLGMPIVTGKFPALEHFKSPRSRPTATKVALEASIQDTLVRIWTQIKEFAGQMFEKVKAIVAGLIKNYGMLESHLEKLLARARAIPATHKPEKAELDKPSLAKFFHGMSPVEALSEAGKFQSGLAKILDAVGQGLGENADAAAAGGKLAEVVKGMGLSKLPGGTELKVEASENGFDVSFADIGGDAKTIKALTASEAADVAGTALQIAKSGKDLQAVAGKVESITKSTIILADRVLKVAAGKAEGNESKAVQLKKAASAANSTTKVVQKLASKLPALHFATVKNAADLVSASLSNLKGEKAPAAEPAAA